MWLVVLLSGCLLIAQYHVVSSWIIASPNQVPNKLERNIDVNMILKKLLSDSKFIEGIQEDTLKDIIKTVAQYCVDNDKVPDFAPLYIITPTYRRPEQIPELTRLAQTLMHIKNVHWLVIEDAVVKTPHVTELLIKTGITFEHLLGKYYS
jgi:beta-1,3-glucuronyltransferase